MIPWEKLAVTEAPDGAKLELRRRGHEYLILADGHDLMSSEDQVSSRALAEHGCAHIDRAAAARVLVGGLGMGYTLSEALRQTGPNTRVEVAELVSAVVDWNREYLGALADHPLDDPRAIVVPGDVRTPINNARGIYDAILLDVDNGPDALAHAANDALYSPRGLAHAFDALRPGGVLAVWSFSDDPRFSQRLKAAGFATTLHRVGASRKGRGRYHFVWTARRS